MREHKHSRKRPVSFDQVLYGAGNVDYDTDFTNFEFGDGNIAPQKQTSAIPPEVLVSGTESKKVSSGGVIYNERSAPTVSREAAMQPYYDEEWANWAMSLDTPGKRFDMHHFDQMPYGVTQQPVEDEDDEGGYESIWDFIESAISGVSGFAQSTKQIKKDGDIILDNIGDITEDNYLSMGASEAMAQKMGNVAQRTSNTSRAVGQAVGDAVVAEAKGAAKGVIGVSGGKSTFEPVTVGMEAAESVGLAAGRGLLLAI